MSTLQAVNADVTNVQQAAQLWTPQFSTGTAATFYYQPQPIAQPEQPKPRKLSPLEWLNEQVGEVLALAKP